MIFAPQDVALIAVVGFILFGPKKLPEMAKSLGSSIVEFKKAMKSGHEPAADGTATTTDPNAQPATATAAVPAAPANPAVAAAPPQQQQLALPAQGHDASRPS